MRKTWISFFAALFALSLQAQEMEESLYKAGFENILLKEEADTLKVFFEHREFRSPYHSMRYARLLLPEMPVKNLVWVPLYHNTPLGKYTAGDLVFQKLDGEDREFYRANNQAFKGYRFNFRIRPDFSARFGYYSHPFQTKFNLVLDSRIYLARGLSLQTGISIPVENSLDNQSMQPRLAPSMLHYFTQPKNGHFIGISAGTFYYERYGLDLQYRYAPPDRRWSFGLESGLTGFYWFNGTSLYSGHLDDLYTVADVEFRLGLENLSLRLSGGQFLFADKGIRLDLIKQFGAVDIGFHAAITKAGTTGGFQLAFPLFPGTIFRTRKIELRTTEEFRWEYSYNNEDPVARKFRIGMPRLSDLLRQYNAGFMRSQL